MLPLHGSQRLHLALDQPLNFNHYGDPRGIPDGFGGHIDETAEVAVLARNIVIAGTDEPAPHDLEGGHFIVFMTNTPQHIEGVQFLHMGQQGTLGRYPLHFHVCGDQTRRSVVRKNLIMNSKQRCIVIHATFNATIDNNVAYNTSGHCFMTEEGSETGNTFIRNLGLRTKAVGRTISATEYKAKLGGSCRPAGYFRSQWPLKSKAYRIVMIVTCYVSHIVTHISHIILL